MVANIYISNGCTSRSAEKSTGKLVDSFMVCIAQKYVIGRVGCGSRKRPHANSRRLSSSAIHSGGGQGMSSLATSHPPGGSSCNYRRHQRKCRFEAPHLISSYTFRVLSFSPVPRLPDSSRHHNLCQQLGYGPRSRSVRATR